LFTFSARFFSLSAAQNAMPAGDAPPEKVERLGSPKSGDKSHQGKVQLLFPKQFCSLFYPIIVLFVILFVLRTAMHRLKSSLQRQPMQNAFLDHSVGQTFTATKHFQGDRVSETIPVTVKAKR
jgi:hypothetical protein